MTAIPCPSCGAPLDVLAPELVVAYLVRKGWRLYGTAGEWAVWSRGEDEDGLDVPIGAESRATYWHTFINDLRKLERRPASSILGEMRLRDLADWTGPDEADCERVAELLGARPDPALDAADDGRNAEEYLRRTREMEGPER